MGMSWLSMFSLGRRSGKLLVPFLGMSIISSILYRIIICLDFLFFIFKPKGPCNLIVMRIMEMNLSLDYVRVSEDFEGNNLLFSFQLSEISTRYIYSLYLTKYRNYLL